MLLWKKAAKVWKAKGYSHTTAADALEGKFGEGKGYGRSRIALLVTTQCEPCPRQVERFILDELPILDPQRWAEYLREAANEPPEEQATATASESGNVEALLSAVGVKLDAAFSAVGRAFTSVRGKLGVAEAAVNHVDAKIDLLDARLDHAEVRRAKDKKEILRAVWGSKFTLVAVMVFMQCQHLPPPVSGGTVNGRTGVAESAARAAPQAPYGSLVPGIGGGLGERKMGRPMPHKALPNQAIAPCRGSAKTFYESCWIGPMMAPAPCPPDQFEEGGYCYVPEASDPKFPVGAAAQ